jgi:hypothetical protein
LTDVTPAETPVTDEPDDPGSPGGFEPDAGGDEGSREETAHAAGLPDFRLGGDVMAGVIADHPEWVADPAAPEPGPAGSTDLPAMPRTGPGGLHACVMCGHAAHSMFDAGYENGFYCINPELCEQRQAERRAAARDPEAAGVPG